MNGMRSGGRPLDDSPTNEGDESAATASDSRLLGVATNHPMEAGKPFNAFRERLLKP